MVVTPLLLDDAVAMPVDEPPVLTAVVAPTVQARSRLHDTPVHGALAKPPALGWRMRGLLDLGPILKRVQRAAWE